MNDTYAQMQKHSAMNSAQPSANLADHLAAGQAIGSAGNTLMEMMRNELADRRELEYTLYGRLSGLCTRAGKDPDGTQGPDSAPRVEPNTVLDHIAAIIDDIARVQQNCHRCVSRLEEII